MAKRISLREFQQSLVERLTSARRGEASRALLGVQTGRELWLLELGDSGEVVPPPPLTPVPLTQPWFSGLANVRGTLYSVVDFSAFLGGAPTVRAGENRLLLVGGRYGMNSAILVTRTLGLKNPDELEPRAAPTDVRPWVGEEYSDTRGQPWKKLHVRSLLAQPQFLNVGV
jgi:twitching motility protein PilI